MYRLSLFLLLLPLSLFGQDQYRVSYDPQHLRVDVEACFDGEAPAYLHRSKDAASFSDGPRQPNGGWKSGGSGSRIYTKGLSRNACVEWSVDLGRAVERNDYRLAMDLGPERGQGILSRGDLWFWRDNEQRHIEVRVSLPDGYSLSTPWKLDDTKSGGPVFLPSPTPASWSTRLAIGQFKTRAMEVGGTQLRVAAVGAFGDESAEAFFKWIASTAEAVANVHGQYPQQQPQILVVAIGAQREAVPWAHVVRGGGVAAEFFVDQTRPIEEFYDDWTAMHELSHMLLPYVSSRDRWLSEGLASYYQNVLRARNGQLSEAEAWEKLDAGFDRGKRATRGGSLAQATRSGRSSTMRVYWSGAAMMLKADSRLRALSGGRQSLDTALAQLHACCMREGKVWRARALFKKLDELTNFSVFVPLYQAHVSDNDFPELASTYEFLGLRAANQGLVLDEKARGSRIRHYIMNG